MKRQDYYDYTDVSPYREVSLAALVTYVLRKWRILLLAGLIGAVLLGGLQVVRYRGRRDSINEKRATYEQEMEGYENARVSYQEEINELEDTINQRQNYVRDSVLMNIDAQHAGIATAVLTVRVPELANEADADDTAGTLRMNDLVRTFCQYVRGGENAEAISAEVGIASGDLRELVSASYEETPRQVTTSGTNQTTLYISDQTTGILTVTARAGDQETAGRILDLLLARMEERAAALRETEGEFELVTLSRDLTTGVDNELMTYQNLKFAEIYTLQNNLNNKQKFLTALAKPSRADAYSAKTLLKTGIKYGIAGFVGVFGLLALVLAFWILLSGRILTPAEIDRKYKFKTLAVFDRSPDIKGLFIDRFLHRPADAVSAMDTEDTYDLLFSRIRNIAGAGARSGVTGPVLLVGVLSDKKIHTLQKALAERAAGKGERLGFRCVSDPVRHPASLHMLRECGCVVLAGELGRTTYADFRRTVDLVDDTGKPVIGTVYF